MKTTDPREGIALGIGRLPTTKCESCGAGWWDTDIHEEFKEAKTIPGIKDAVRGEVCPECGTKQDP